MKKWLKENKEDIIIITLLIVIFTLLGYVIHKMDNNFIKTCTDMGYSYDYCIAHK